MNTQILLFENQIDRSYLVLKELKQTISHKIFTANTA